MKKYKNKNVNKISFSKRVPRKFKKFIKNKYGKRAYSLVKEGSMKIHTYSASFIINNNEEIKVKYEWT